MAIPEGRMSARFLVWFPLACFVALLVTIAIVSILPPDHHLAYAIVEWVEMLVGTVSRPYRRVCSLLMATNCFARRTGLEPT